MEMKLALAKDFHYNSEYTVFSAVSLNNTWISILIKKTRMAVREWEYRIRHIGF